MIMIFNDPANIGDTHVRVPESCLPDNFRTSLILDLSAMNDMVKVLSACSKGMHHASGVHLQRPNNAACQLSTNEGCPQLLAMPEVKEVSEALEDLHDHIMTTTITEYIVFTITNILTKSTTVSNTHAMACYDIKCQHT